MVETALEFTADVLNQYLQTKYGLTDDVVQLNNVIQPDGNVPSENRNKIVISLLNIEQETNKQFYGRNQQLPDGSYANINPFERYNLDLLFSSNFDDYKETLKFLNATIAFFQANSSVSQANYANIPDGFKKIDYEIEQISYHQMHSLWSAMGAKYQPSIIYKIRLITIQTDQLIAILPTVNSTSNQIAQ